MKNRFKTLALAVAAFGAVSNANAAFTVFKGDNGGLYVYNDFRVYANTSSQKAHGTVLGDDRTTTAFADNKVSRQWFTVYYKATLYFQTKVNDQVTFTASTRGAVKTVTGNYTNTTNYVTGKKSRSSANASNPARFFYDTEFNVVTKDYGTFLLYGNRNAADDALGWVYGSPFAALAAENTAVLASLGAGPTRYVGWKSNNVISDKFHVFVTAGDTRDQANENKSYAQRFASTVYWQYNDKGDEFYISAGTAKSAASNSSTTKSAGNAIEFQTVNHFGDVTVYGGVSYGEASNYNTPSAGVVQFLKRYSADVSADYKFKAYGLNQKVYGAVDFYQSKSSGSVAKVYTRKGAAVGYSVGVAKGVTLYFEAGRYSTKTVASKANKQRYTYKEALNQFSFRTQVSF